MKIEVSIGEAIDKLSILELKLSRINNEEQQVEIQKEINILEECKNYKNLSDGYYYKLLIYFNEQIWEMTDIIKNMEITNPKFSEISNQIFVFNQKRFRIKNVFNILSDSNIKEQKSYKKTHCKIIIDDEELFYNKIEEINYLSFEYDIISFESKFISTISNIFKHPNIYYNNVNYEVTNTINLYYFSISHELKNIYDFTPIVYISGGKLGDLIHNLSVINEFFYKFGRKGILFISENSIYHGEKFQYSLLDTYNDTYVVFKKQRYIKEYYIHNNETFNINLNVWRKSPRFWSQNFYETYKSIYNIEWGLHKWIEIDKNNVIEELKDTVLVNFSIERLTDSVNIDELHQYKKNMKFICFDKEQYTFFCNKTNINIDCIKVNNFYDLCVCINSCKLFIGGQTMPLALSNSMHKKSIICFFEDFAKILHNGLHKIWKNVDYIQNKQENKQDNLYKYM
jgi:hypothetical protein